MNSKDYNLLNEVTKLWGTVQRENFLDRHLVTESEWDDWVKFDGKVIEKLNCIIKEAGKSLPSNDRVYLERLKEQVSTTKRLTTEELILRGEFSEVRDELIEGLYGNYFQGSQYEA